MSGYFGDSPECEAANQRHEEFLVLAREGLDELDNDYNRANLRLRRKFAKQYPGEGKMHEREAATIINCVLRERGLL